MTSLKAILKAKGVIVPGLGTREGRRREQATEDRRGGARVKKAFDDSSIWIHKDALPAFDELVKKAKSNFDDAAAPDAPGAATDAHAEEGGASEVETDNSYMPGSEEELGTGSEEEWEDESGEEWEDESGDEEGYGGYGEGERGVPMSLFRRVASQLRRAYRT